MKTYDEQIAELYNRFPMYQQIGAGAYKPGLQNAECLDSYFAYATEITLSHGIPLETVSKMLGHSRIETTQIYAKVTDDKIDSDTDGLNERIAERFSVII